MKNGKKLLEECVRMILLLAAVSIVAFLLITKAPIDPLVSYVGTNSTLSEEAKEEIAEEWGLNDPLPVRFVTWVKHAIHGDLGMSITYKKPVIEVIKTRFSYSIVLMMLAWVFSGIIGFLLGVVCGIRQGGILDRIVKTFCLVIKSAPVFWIGLLMLTIFAVQLGWFPIGMAVPAGKLAEDVTLGDRIYHLILPVLTLTIVSISEVVLYTRQKVIEIMNSDFILYAKARGENNTQIVKRHVLRNVALPAITVQFSSFNELFGGMALAETVFAYPGIGNATTAAAMNADVPLLLGIAIFSALFVFTGNLIANLLYGVFDPRIREGRNVDKKRFWNRRVIVVLFIAVAIVYLAGIFFWGIFMEPSCYASNYADKLMKPGFKHLFGTDFVGRDMFYRCIKGLSNSLIIGVLASVVSSVIALVAGIASAVFGGWVDKFVNWCVDLCMGLPHLVLLMLISFMMGKGVKGVTVAVALTHWPSLTRIVRSEVMQIRSAQYVQAAYKMGKSRTQVAIQHILPHVLPAYLIGLVLLFPHAIMHEASITFLGFGMPAEMPAIGVILSEAMNHITTGKWWLALFPGLMLLIAVVLFDVIGENLKKLWNPGSANE